MAYNLGDLKLVVSSRYTVYVNALPRSVEASSLLVTDAVLLNQMDAFDSAVVKSGPKSQFGKRDAYSVLYKQQFHKYGHCNVNFGIFLQTFETTYVVPKQRHYCQINDINEISVNGTGFVIDPVSFIIANVSKTVVLCGGGFNTYHETFVIVATIPHRIIYIYRLSILQ